VTRRSDAGFTVDEAAHRWRCSPVLAGEFLRDFAVAGFVEKIEPDRWRVTHRGYALACEVGLVDDREQAP
jgi:hypothetical protein